MFNIKKIFKDTISPKKCYSCNEEWHFLCQKCLSNINIFSPYCYICKEKNKNFIIHKKCLKYVNYDKVIVLTHYKNYIISKLIKDFKFYWKKDILEDFWLYLSSILIENEYIINIKEYIIVNSPMYLFRKLIRWYNHSEILAKYVSEFTWIDYISNIIIKTRNTKQQSKLSRSERKENILDSFLINKKLENNIKWKNIILVDDVVSTWSTINEISKELKNNWAKMIIALVIASD